MFFFHLFSVFSRASCACTGKITCLFYDFNVCFTFPWFSIDRCICHIEKKKKKFSVFDNFKNKHISIRFEKTSIFRLLKSFYMFWCVFFKVAFHEAIEIRADVHSKWKWKLRYETTSEWRKKRSSSNNSNSRSILRVRTHTKYLKYY